MRFPGTAWSLLAFLVAQLPGLSGGTSLACSLFPVVTGEIRLRTYSGADVNSYQEYSPSDVTGLMANANFMSSRSAALFIHGWNASTDGSYTKRIVSALLANSSVNVICVNWTQLASGLYPTAYMNMYVAAKQVVASLVGLQNNNYPLSNIHLIGHSLGAQMAGQISRCSPSKLPWITGLDPANPGFFPGINGTSLSASDASFVDIVHTDGGVMGTYPATGAIDFYPNGGVPVQPGCDSSDPTKAFDEQGCSHARAISLYVESISFPANFLCWLADSWEDFKERSSSYNGDNALRMGWDVDKSSRGKCYLYTNSISPYGRNVSGNTPGT